MNKTTDLYIVSYHFFSCLMNPMRCSVTLLGEPAA